jgi:23S rRNA (cytidine2498-2'-O)-methyltransferase
MHCFLWTEDSEAELRWELARSFPGVTVRTAGALLLEADFELVPGHPLPRLAFARQWLPGARPIQAESVRSWAGALFDALVGVLPEDQPWMLHLEPCYGVRATHRIGARAWHSQMRRAEDGGRNRREPGVGTGKDGSRQVPDAEAGRHRCRLIREALAELLQKKRRSLLRQLRNEAVPFTPNDSLVQLLLTGPDTGLLSVALAPLPFAQRHLLSCFPKGEVPVASDKSAPSRAFAKLVEAEQRLGRAIRPGETCVDLGASPGSWSYVAVNRGARVLAVDRSPLREDLMLSRQVQFQPGDAFRFEPRGSVDWLLCDVIAAPERSAELLLEWLRRGWCRHFVVTLKLKDTPGADVLTQLKRELPSLAQEFFLTRLCANKKEVCVFGSR